MAITAHNDTRVRYARAGFSLAEIMIAVMIIGLVTAMVGPALNNAYKKSQKRTAKASMIAFKKGISEYEKEVGQLPAKLKDLVIKPRGEDRAAKKWDGPYVGEEGATEVPQDPWSENFVYKVTANGKHPYELYSYGPNKKGSPKEEWINVWDE